VAAPGTDHPPEETLSMNGRWVMSAHEIYGHALDPEQADGAVDHGYTEARCVTPCPATV
jgi:hypothetical protein